MASRRVTWALIFLKERKQWSINLIPGDGLENVCVLSSKMRHHCCTTIVSSTRAHQVKEHSSQFIAYIFWLKIQDIWDVLWASKKNQLFYLLWNSLSELYDPWKYRQLNEWRIWKRFFAQYKMRNCTQFVLVQPTIYFLSSDFSLCVVKWRRLYRIRVDILYDECHYHVNSRPTYVYPKSMKCTITSLWPTPKHSNLMTAFHRPFNRKYKQIYFVFDNMLEVMMDFPSAFLDNINMDQ